MRSDVPLAAGVIAETVGINRSTTRRSINTLIHRPSSTSCQPSTVRQFTSEFRNASASLQRSAAGASTYCESRETLLAMSSGEVVERRSRRQRRDVGGRTCRSGWISRRDRVDTAVGLQHRRREVRQVCAVGVAVHEADGALSSPSASQVGSPIDPGAGDRRWPKACRDRTPASNQVGLGARKRRDASLARVDSLQAISCRDRGGRETNSIIRIDHV